VQAAKDAGPHGFGMSSVRFIWVLRIFKTLEKIAEFWIRRYYLYAAAFDANGVFEPLLGEQDCIISDSLNHASIIDGYVYAKQHVTAMKTVTWKIWSNN
jgi:glycine C-acetyltransferase